MSHRTHSIDPGGMHTSPAFAHGVIAPAASTLYVGGQNGIDSAGQLVDGVAAQTRRAMENLLTVLAAAGTGPEHVTKLNVYLTTGVDVQAAFAASGASWGENRTAITVLIVAGLALPGALVEVDAIAVIP